MAKDEIIHILNEAGEITGETSRKEAERDNLMTENVLIFVFNSLGRVWLQLRPSTKVHYPGLWDISACGGVLSNETHQQAALRETEEETGLNIELSYVESFINVFPGDNNEKRRRLSHVYIGSSDEIPQPNDEVDEFKNWDPAKLRKAAVANEEAYVPSFVTELDIAVRAFRNSNLSE